ncbi:ThuA domain-containing protein [Saccharopolyspora sp. K220]|uniref:ThuA domain-containing protein n=1 Tax=Saccharopolyspora soli TaxID=2926618 RepID=UPI001F5A579D|nr:ThuA domain-containing protein [Saccharopolyspora soli]MCI2422745.1 ThuA domain-containing protein [Saccharopolyspora soli]
MTSEVAARHALVVRGGWEGHTPVAVTDAFAPWLTENGFTTTITESLDVYLDAELLARTDLVLQCWTMGTITAEQSAGLATAVAAGTGLAGWHGGIVDSFRGDITYQRLTGGQFLAHPGGFVTYSIDVVPDRADHPVVAGIEHVEVHTEQYWPLTDAANDVLATTTIPTGPESEWPEAITVPAVWTRRWGAGRVFVSTVGHQLSDLEVPEIRTITERGLLWASR